MSVSGLEPRVADHRRWRGAISLGVSALALTACATPQPTARVSYSHGHEHFAQSKYGHASAKVVADGDRVPRGGGQYLVGRPYMVAGHRYYPAENPSYTAVGMASWYGAAFHGRRTANGEVYDMASLSAAHPTMPRPSYARVTNLGNGYSVIVRVNDRGPYHAGRVTDVSSRVADVLDMKAMGTAKVKIDYVGPAPIEGSDDSQLLASLRTDGSPANMIGFPSASVMVANAAAEQTDTIWSFFSGGRGGQQPQPEAQPTPAPAPEPPPVQVASAPEPPLPPPEPVRVAAAPVDAGLAPAESADTDPSPPEPIRSAHLSKGAVPLPPPRPFDLSLSRSSTIVAAASSSSGSSTRVASAHAVIPPRRPELHASAERALYYSGPTRLPPKKPTTGAFDHVKSAKTARADY
jgi:rare lipoprotein A